VRKEFLRKKCVKEDWMVLGFRRNIEALKKLPVG
jgi:hypothetical protein